jgi:hypothetical protein
MSARSPRRTPLARHWEQLNDEDLLDLRFRDLRLSLRQSPAHTDLCRLHALLERRHIRFKPHAWLSTEWFSPDGIPGIAVPFFAAHPRLSRLERKMIGEAEGGNRKWRQRILRHEAGHAIDTAFGLRRRRDWRHYFGPASKRYSRDYAVRPGSRRFVLHLDHWYAQSHPTEDFAETFAVWLQPKTRWRREYADWPALEKLEFVDFLMEELAGRRPANADRSVVAAISTNNRTLREHYRRRLPFRASGEHRYDAWLLATFPTSDAAPAGARSAASMLRSISPRLRRRLIAATGGGAYLTDHVIEATLHRLQQLQLMAPEPRLRAERAVRKLLERIIDDVLRRNKERYIL